jgi:transposase
MLNFGRRRVFLCRKPVDMRKAFDSLADLVRIDLAMDPFQGDVFIFLGKDRTRAKVLVWEANGFWLCSRRLETARFRIPQAIEGDTSGAAVLPMNAFHIKALLEEVVPRLLRREPPKSHEHS